MANGAQARLPVTNRNGMGSSTNRITEAFAVSRLSAGSRYKFLEKTERSRNRGSSVFTRESWGCYHQRKFSNE